MKTATLGILTGISYVSGIDYFKKINEKVLAGSPLGYVMSPNPPIVMVSIDCDEYVHYLSSKLFEQEEQTQKEIYEIICQELSYNVFTDKSRAKMVKEIRRLEVRGEE